MTLSLLWPFRLSELKLNDTFAHILKINIYRYDLGIVLSVYYLLPMEKLSIWISIHTTEKYFFHKETNSLFWKTPSTVKSANAVISTK